MAKNERAVLDLIINGQQSKASLKEIGLEATRTRSALLKMREADDPAAYKQKLADYQRLTAAQKEMRARIDDTSTAFSRFKANMASTMAGVVGGNVITTALSAAANAIPSLINKYREFNAASQELSAVTGVTGKDLSYLNEQAAKLGPTFGKSGAEMLEAYKLMASAKPELLNQKELLVETTKAALTLAQAGKIDLATATQVTAESLNQFGESADQANRYINVIAAGAKEGSAEINEMGVALKNSGTVAAAQGVSFEQTNAILQSMSTIALKGGEAGTQLRNVLLTLGSGSDETNPRVVGLQKALNNLAAQNLSTAEMTKLFGKENITAAQHIITHRDQIVELTKKVTGTQEAFTQATANNATLDQQLAMFWARVEGVAVSLGTRLAPSITKVVSSATNLLGALPQMALWLEKNGEWLVVTGIPALIAYNATLIKATAAAAANTLAEGYRRLAFQAGYTWLLVSEAATKAYALATGVLTGQITLQTAVVTVARNIWAAFSAVLLANPIGIVVGALGGLVAAIKYFSEHTDRALDLERKKAALQQQGEKATKQNAQAIENLNQKVALSNDLSKVEQENLKKTIALKQLETRARLASALAKAREIARQEADPTFWQGVKQGVSNVFTGNWDLDAQKAQQTEANKAAAYAEAKRLANVEQMQADLQQYDRMLQQMNGSKASSGLGGGASGGLTDEQKKAAEAKKKQVQQDADELERLLAESRKRVAGGEESDYEREVAAFAAKYSKMYDLAKDNEAKINEIKTLSLAEWSEIEKAYYDKQDEERRKQQEKDNKEGFDAAMKVADQTYSDSIGQAEINQAQNPKKIGDAELQMQKLQADQVYLTQKLLLEQTFAQQSADTQRQLTENWNEQVKLRATTEKQYAEQMKQAEWALQDAKRAAMQQGFEVLTGFLDKGTIAYKAALIAQKAFAIAQVIVDMNREIAQIYANPTWSLMPDGGLALKTANATAAKIRAGISIASIVGTTIGQLAAKADGGYTGLQELYPGAGGPSGFTSGPTLFNMGRRSYIAGEAGREFVISNRALQDPIVADFTRMLDVAQRTGNYSQLGAASSPMKGLTLGIGSDTKQSISQEVGLAILNELRQSRALMQQKGSQSVEFNYRLYELYKNNVDQIRIDNRL